MHPSFITRIYNMKRMRHDAKEKHSFKINQQASKDTYQKDTYRRTCVDQPNPTALCIQQEPSHRQYSFEYLPECHTHVALSLSRRGLEEIIRIICRKWISRFATQASVHGWSAQSFKCRLGTKPQIGSFSRETNLLAPQPSTSLVHCCMGVHENHWKYEPKILQ